MGALSFGPELLPKGASYHGLVRHLRYSHGVGIRTRSGLLKGSLGCAVHVRLVVRAVEVLAVPARREVVDRHDAGRARLGGEVWRLPATSQNGLQTRIPETRVASRYLEGVGRRAADRHAETLWQCQRRRAALVEAATPTGLKAVTFFRGFPFPPRSFWV